MNTQTTMHAHEHSYVHIFMCVCMCVCARVEKQPSHGLPPRGGITARGMTSTLSHCIQAPAPTTICRTTRPLSVRSGHTHKKKREKKRKKERTICRTTRPLSVRSGYTHKKKREKKRKKRENNLSHNSAALRSLRLHTRILYTHNSLSVSLSLSLSLSLSRTHAHIESLSLSRSLSPSPNAPSNLKLHDIYDYPSPPTYSTVPSCVQVEKKNSEKKLDDIHDYPSPPTYSHALKSIDERKN